MLTEERLWGSVRRGSELVAHLPEVAEADAPPRVRQVYRALRDTLRVPYVDTLWQVLANYPEYLELAWRELEPNLGTHTAERIADALRARAVEELPLGRRDQPFSLHVAGLSDAEVDQVCALNETASYVLPKLLLAATGLAAALAGETMGGEGTRARLLPRGPAPGAVALQPLDPQRVPEEVARHLSEIAQVHGHPRPASYFLAIARWPAYLEVLWHDLRPHVRGDWYDERGRELQHRALYEWAAMPHRLRAGVDEVRALGYSLARVEEVRCILAFFRTGLLPDLLVDLALARVLLDGPASALHSRLSLH
ncbi:MAG: hypothetical protein HY690_15545 [Chloroflexi bacterium]|nr:hypothetical protein [Chloroflexota bacterium]